MTILDAQLGSPYIVELVALFLSFPTSLISLESEFYNSDIAKNMRRGQTVTVQKRETNSLSVCCLAILTILEAELVSP